MLQLSRLLGPPVYLGPKSMINKRGPNIEPCGTLESIFSQKLSVFFFIFYLLSDPVVWMFNEAKSRPYACNLAITKSWLKQSKRSVNNTFNKSVNNTPKPLLLSVASFQVSKDNARDHILS